MSYDPWRTDELDLDGYLSRIGVPARAPSVAALDELCRAHVLTFPFDNLDVLLGQHPGVGLPEVQEKFLGRGRGGYCFEHGTLFAAVLERLGYVVERRLGRVGDPDNPRTHMVAVVRVDGEHRVVDPGIGRPPPASLPLVDGAEVDAGGWRYRVVSGVTSEPSWAIERSTRDGWQGMHTFDELPVRPVDVVMGHHFTSTRPESHFVTGLVFGRYVAPREHLGMALDGDGFAVTTRRPDEPTQKRRVAMDEGVALLGEIGALSLEEIERLPQVLGRLHGSVPPG